jgi:LytS/YehU family sensor histidine kinase
MIRLTLEHSKDVFVTLDENIGYLKAYLEMEQLRFGESFTYSIHTDETIDTDEVLIPSLMIQPLVENAIWHGLLQADTEKKLQVDFRLVESKIVCTVEDNGIGFHRSEALRQKQRPLHRSMGLQNLHKRIGIINEKYNTGCSLAIIDVSDSNHSGTKAVLQLNLITTYQNT